MSEETLKAQFELIIQELRKFQDEARETHHEIFERLSIAEKKLARMEVVAGGGIFAAGALLGVVIPKLFG
ncbi:hypothetical protein [Cloacibacillus sp. An23]|uniref:hypothetical protein n=1 Tax=Cloacibacillus sp. An23 TaxID=1965591 RepID=UPI000B39454B|nr:hypothetical protein [Cloacibacillus sp. An23]OUO92193.1 hypothetical protein B5F39_11185 [Cloacibacillus sp. An23]